MANLGIAIGLTTLAGLATGIGSILAFFARTTNYRFLSIATGFSAGVMLFVSFTEILHKANIALGETFSEKTAYGLTTLGFFIGIAGILLIDLLIPHAENPHEARTEQQIEELHRPIGSVHALVLAEDTQPAPATASEAVTPGLPQRLMRMGLFTALAIGIHNFPEGLATFAAALSDPRLGFAIALAIALHNIPEGISVSVPIYYATGSRRQAFIYSFVSGIAEPIGAIIGYLLLRPILSAAVMGGLFAGVAGIMIYISLDQLLPTSRAFGKGHDSLIGLLSGMAIMAVSLIMLK